MQRNSVPFGKSDRTYLKNLGSKTGQLQHFVVGDHVNFSCLSTDVGISGIHPLNISKNLTDICLQRCSQGNGSGIGTATPQGSDVTIIGYPLETGNSNHFTLIKMFFDKLCVNFPDSGLGVHFICVNAYLVAKKGDGITFSRLHGHGKK